MRNLRQSRFIISEMMNRDCLRLRSATSTTYFCRLPLLLSRTLMHHWRRKLFLYLIFRISVQLQLEDYLIIPISGQIVDEHWQKRPALSSLTLSRLCTDLLVYD